MLIGNGLVANAFLKYTKIDNIVIFASGVSNSKNAVAEEYLRELLLLKKTIIENLNKTIIYFSTCSIYDNSVNKNPYVKHKLQLENLIKKTCTSFYIFRVSNIVGNSENKNTIVNFLVESIKGEREIEIWETATRNLIDIDDFAKLCTYIIDNKKFLNKVVNIANKNSYPVKQIVVEIEKHLNKKANYHIIKEGENFNIDTAEIDNIADLLKINFNDSYLPNLLKKYYKNNDL